MATLIRNVWIDGRYYGPDHGNADEVPAEYLPLVPADAWSSPPMIDRPPKDNDETPKVSRALSYDLLAQADALGIRVDKRWGEERLRNEIAAAKRAQEAA